MKYGERIREIRTMLKINQKEMANILGISQSYLSGIELGIKKPNAEVIMRLLWELNVKISWLKNGVGRIFSENFNYLTEAKNVREEIIGYKGKRRGETLFKNEGLLFFTIESDNMLPTLRRGDTLLVDTTIKEPDEEGIYLFDVDSSKIVKRFVKFPEKKLTNDSPLIKNNDIFFDSSIICLGKVVSFVRKV